MDFELIQCALGPLRLESAELHALGAALSCLPRPAIRLRPGLSASELPFDTEPVRWHERGCFLAPQTRAAAYLHYGAGDYYIQDASSLLAVAALQAQPGELICDLCAAPGGKATAILDAVAESGWLLANEAIHSRVNLLRFQLARYGVPRYNLAQLDPDQLADLLGPRFDAVLVDAPCTGQSLLSRGRQTPAAFQAQTIDHCCARQMRILNAAARLVRPGGRLVYSTCTFSFRENEAQIERFLAAHGHWQLVPCHHLAPWETDAYPGCYRLWPHRHGCGGAFAAVMRHNATSTETDDTPQFMNRCESNTTLPFSLAEWGSLSNAVFHVRGDRCIAWPEAPPLRIHRAAPEGPEIACQRGKTWFPAQALATWRERSWSPRALVELDNAAAAAYLQGGVVSTQVRGWAVAVWRGRPLGWLKGDGMRGKNHLPKPARLSGRIMT